MTVTEKIIKKNPSPYSGEGFHYNIYCKNYIIQQQTSYHS